MEDDWVFVEIIGFDVVKVCECLVCCLGGVCSLNFILLKIFLLCDVNNIEFVFIFNLCCVFFVDMKFDELFCVWVWMFLCVRKGELWFWRLLWWMGFGELVFFGDCGGLVDDFGKLKVVVLFRVEGDECFW